MSIEQIIHASVNKDPLALKEALEEELRARMALALEAKMTEEDDEDEDEEDDEDDDTDEDEDDEDMKEAYEISEATFTSDIDYNHKNKMAKSAKEAGLKATFSGEAAGGNPEMTLVGDENKIVAFLKKQGLKDKEISRGMR